MRPFYVVTLLACYAGFVMAVLLASSLLTRLVVAGVYALLASVGIGPTLASRVLLPLLVTLAGAAFIHFVLWSDRQLPSE